ncbi:MAG: rhamnose ABC transporter substrate-binding protein [Lachnospiraceae bacterium]|nr:rhamnose ABC transporter substrate-binding protein [Lachnospiraceae bacterium]
MKKKVLSVLLAATMVASVLAGCGSAAQTAAPAAEPAAAEESAPAEDTAAADTAAADTAAADTADAAADTAAADTAAPAASGGGTYALVTKSAGNPFMERMASGFQEAVEASGGTVVIQNPEAATPDAQISVVQSLISQGVSSIAVDGNDANALTAVLTEAKDAGIKILTLDSDVAPDTRTVYCNQAGVSQIGQTLMEAVYDLTGGEGDWAILSATSQATNQNAWIDAMKSLMESDSKYAKLNLVEVAYGDDEPQKSTDQTQALLQNYPDLKVICAPTTVGIAAAAKVLQDQKSSVKLTGLGLPSEMAEYIGDDDAHSCPYMYLWNPIDLGRLAGYTSIALVDGSITGAAGDTFTAGELGSYTIEEIDGSTQIILGPPFKFDPSNIDEWKSVY